MINSNLSRSENRYFPLLDGLRGLAVLLIIIRHCVHSDIYLIDFIRMKCWIGVDIFFALSGFLITNILLKDKGASGFFKRFYLRRILRIFPLYYVSLFLILGIIYIFNVEKNYILVENAFYFITYTQNFYFAFTEEDPGNLLLFHFWSLAVEEHFYLFWPIIVHLFRGMQIFIVCIGIILGCTFLRYYFPSNVNYVATFTRLDGLAAGGAFACLYNSNRFSFKLLPQISILSFIILMLIMVFKPVVFLPFKFTAVGIFSACLVAYCIIDTNLKSVFNYLFNNKPMRTLGKYSYGLYLLHFPVYICFYKFVEEHNILSRIGFSLVLGIIVFLSYKFLELPFLRLKKKLVPYG